MRCLSLLSFALVACGPSAGDGTKKPSGSTIDTASAGPTTTPPTGGTEPTDTGDTAPETPPEPTPAFTISKHPGGWLAVREDGLYPFELDGYIFPPLLVLYLFEQRDDEPYADGCSVTITPGFDDFASEHVSNKPRGTVVFNPRGSVVLDDECGWDDAWILAELDRQWGQFEIGFVDGDYPGLIDVTWVPHGEYSFGIANSTLSNSGSAFVLNGDGTVDGSATVSVPYGHSLPTAMYQF